MALDGPPPSSHRSRIVPALLVSALVLLAAGAALRWYIITDNPPGAFAYARAPQDEFLATARTHSDARFWGGRREFFEFSLLTRDPHSNDPNEPWHYPPVRRIVMDRVSGIPFPTVPRGPAACTIHWMPDSSGVTFDLQGVQISMSTTNL